MDALITTRKLALDKGKPKVSPDSGDRFERSLLRTRNTIVHDGHPPVWGNGRIPGRMLKKFRLLTHPTPPRQDASLRGQGRRR